MLQRLLNAVDRVVTDALKLETEVGLGLFTQNSLSLEKECRVQARSEDSV